jgi:hypothetical protein
VDFAQGYWFSRALEAKAFLELLRARTTFPLPPSPAGKPDPDRRRSPRV